MVKITAISKNRRGGKKLGIYLGGKRVLNLEPSTVLKLHLQVGKELSVDELDSLKAQSSYEWCLDTAHFLLKYRSRSEAEMRQRLVRRGFESKDIDIVMEKLREQKLIDDTAFAQQWKESRQSFSPRSQLLTRLELRQKGVADEVSAAVVSEIDEYDAAYQAASTKAQRLAGVDHILFRRRIGEFLRRRGFDYEVIEHTVKRLREEAELKAEDGLITEGEMECQIRG